MPASNNLIVHCDGGARGNPGPAAAGCLIEDSAGKKRFLCGKYLGVATNNQAEYEAVSLALEVINDKFNYSPNIDFYLDSLLVTEQLKGLFKVKSQELAQKLEKIRSLEVGVGKISYTHVPREQNKEADLLVNKSLDEKSNFVEIEQIS